MKLLLIKIKKSNARLMVVFIIMALAELNLIIGSAIDPLHGIRWIVEPLAEYIIKETAMPLFIVFFQIIKYLFMIGLGYMAICSYKRIRGGK